jgi:hypothetical protein
MAYLRLGVKNEYKAVAPSAEDFKALQLFLHHWVARFLGHSKELINDINN